MQKQDALDRLYRRLVDAVRRDHPAAAERSLTIAEVYQHLVPYRSVRAELGFSELAEYEHTLLRLLAGERDYARVELPQVREELQRELRAANPILGVYRDYAAVGVHVNLGAVPASGEEPATRIDGPTPPFPPARSKPEARTVPEPAATAASAAGAGAAATAAAPPPPAPRPAPAPAEEPPRAAAPCRSCSQPLPLAREVRFCPHCGESQKMAPCRACGTALEPEWKFCLRCGYPRRAVAAPR